MRFPVKKIILPNNSFSKLLLCEYNYPKLISYNSQKGSYGWLSTKIYSGKIKGNEGISYDIYTYAKYDYNRVEPYDTCSVRTNIYSRNYEYSINERCKIEFFTIYDNVETNTFMGCYNNNITMIYDIFDNENKRSPNRYSQCEYKIPFELYKKLDMSYSYTPNMSINYNCLKELIERENEK
jgi:hypothetical protein